VSWAAFWQMGGYALFVWSAYGVAALALAAELLLLAARRRAVLRRLNRMQRVGDT
jgi:heme exporter protein D